MPKELSWLPRKALDRMHSDLQLHGDITRAQLAERIIEDASPLAAYRVVEIATTEEDPAIALSAAKYLLDRANGKPKTSIHLNTAPTNPVLQILEGVVLSTEPDPTGSPVTSTPSTQPGYVVEQAPFAPPFREPNSEDSP